MPERLRFAGRHAVVTGASTGIGRAVGLRLAAEGARVSLLSRDTQRLANVVREAGADAAAIRCDVRDEADVDRGFAEAAERHGPIGILVANSGICRLDSDGEAGFRDNVETNLFGSVYSANAARRHLASGPDPRHIVFISSVFARIGAPGYGGYCASKAAILGYMRTLALEVAELEVYVNAVCPGLVDTELAYRDGVDLIAAAQGVSRAAAEEIILAPYPIKRMSEPEEIAGTVAWLCSPDGRGVTGQSIDVNHGLAMP